MDEVTLMSQVRGVAQPFGPRLRVARDNAGLSRRELARRVGVEESSIAAWEDDTRAPRANRLLMLSGVLGVSIGWLLEGREDSHMARAADEPPPAGGQALRADIEQVRTMLSNAQATLQAIAERLARRSPEKGP